jgi:hypothetical protein
MVHGAEKTVRVEVRDPMAATIFLFVGLSRNIGEQVQWPADSEHGENLDGDTHRILIKKSASAIKNSVGGICSSTQTTRNNLLLSRWLGTKTSSPCMFPVLL